MWCENYVFIMKIVIINCGPGLEQIGIRYGYSYNWIIDIINKPEYTFIIKKVYLGEKCNIDDGDIFIITGSKYSVYDNFEWIHKFYHHRNIQEEAVPEDYYHHQNQRHLYIQRHHDVYEQPYHQQKEH